MQAHGAALVRVDAEDRSRDLAAPGADEAREPDDLAGAEGERDVAEHSGAGEPVDFEDDVADLRGQLREELGHVAADHLPHELVDARLGDRRRVDVGAVAHDGDGVAQREHLVEPVGDEQQRAALVAQAAGDREEPLDLDAADSAAVGSSMISTRASSEMALAISMICWSAIERPSVIRSGSSATPSRVKICVASSRIARRSMRPNAIVRLASHEDVLGHREVGEQRRLLVDDGDAGGLGLRGAGEVHRLTVEEELAPSRDGTGRR